MPTYEYECQECGHRFDLFQNITAKPKQKCPKCKKNALKKLISAGAGIIFKGSGFYETDYKRPANNQKEPTPKCGAAGEKAECKSCPAANNKK